MARAPSARHFPAPPARGGFASGGGSVRLSEVRMQLRSRLGSPRGLPDSRSPAVTASEPGSRMRAALRPLGLGGACVPAGCARPAPAAPHHGPRSPPPCPQFARFPWLVPGGLEPWQRRVRPGGPTWGAVPVQVSLPVWLAWLASLWLFCEPGPAWGPASWDRIVLPRGSAHSL